MSAVADDEIKPIKVIFVLHEGFDTVDLTGPFEILQNARHDIKDPKSRAFRCAVAGPNNNDNFVTSSQGLKIKTQLDYEDVSDDGGALEETDVLVVVGGTTDPVLEANGEPIGIVKQFGDLQRKDPSRERTLLSICTGSLFLAKAGVLQGLSATTHPSHYTKLELLCQEAAQRDTGRGTDVQEERYVVNNARFELGEDVLDNPFVHVKRPDPARRKSSARRGSDAFKLARRRESYVKRQNMPLGGLRVITSGGVVAGMDASLYLVAALVSVDSAQAVAEGMQFKWQKGVTVEAIDV